MKMFRLSTTSRLRQWAGGVAMRVSAAAAVTALSSVAAAGGVGTPESRVVEWITWSATGDVPTESSIEEYSDRASALLAVDEETSLRVEGGTFDDRVPFGERRAVRCVLVSGLSCRVQAPDIVVRRRDADRLPGGTLDGWLQLGVVFDADTDRILAIIATRDGRPPKGSDPTRPMVGPGVSFEPYAGTAFESSASDVLGEVWKYFENPASAAEVVLRPRLVTGAWDPESENGINERPLLCWVATVRGAPRTSGESRDMGSFWGLFADKGARFLMGGFLR